MKTKLLFILFTICSSFHITYSQSFLKPSLGQTTFPLDTDVIFGPNYYFESSFTFNFSGYTINDTVNDISLFTIEGDKVELSNLLNQNKPILLVSGSYTCGGFRGKIELLNDLVIQFGNQINIYMVYTLEAHPKPPELCPYTGTDWFPEDNILENVLYSQHQIYQDRINMVDTLSNKRNLLFPVLIDGPCNIWWNNFGPAPNNAYLIKSDGTVFHKQGWFGVPQGEMEVAIMNLLNSNTVSITEDQTSPVEIYPNPTNSYINVYSEYLPYEMELFNSSGKLVSRSENICDKNYTLSMEFFTKGLYYCRIRSEEHQAVYKKVVLQ